MAPPTDGDVRDLLKQVGLPPDKHWLEAARATLEAYGPQDSEASASSEQEYDRRMKAAAATLASISGVAEAVEAHSGKAAVVTNTGPDGTPAAPGQEVDPEAREAERLRRAQAQMWTRPDAGKDYVPAAQFKQLAGTITAPVGFENDFLPFGGTVQGQLLFDNGITVNDPQGRTPRGPAPFMWNPVTNALEPTELGDYAMALSQPSPGQIMTDGAGNLFHYKGDGTMPEALDLPVGFVTPAMMRLQQEEAAEKELQAYKDQERLNRQQEQEQHEEVLTQRELEFDRAKSEFDQQMELKSDEFDQSKTEWDQQMDLKADELVALSTHYAAQEDKWLNDLQLMQDQLTVAEAAGFRQDAIAIEGVIETQNARLDANAVSRAQMANQATQLQAQLNASTAQTQAQLDASATELGVRLGVEVESGNVTRLHQSIESRLNRVLTAASMLENARQFNITERRALAGQAAELMRSPEDVGSVFGFLEGASGGPGKSALSTAISQGKTGITDLSLVPLATNIEARQQLDAGNPTFESLIRAATAGVDPSAAQFKQLAPQVARTQVAATDVPAAELPEAQGTRAQYTKETPRFSLGSAFDPSLFSEEQQLALEQDPTGARFIAASAPGFIENLKRLGRVGRGSLENWEPVLTEDTEGVQGTRLVTSMAHGGVMDANGSHYSDVVLVGDDPSGKPSGVEELAVPLGNGKVMFVPLNGKKAPKGAKKAADGGLFDFNSGLLELDDPEGSIAAARAQLERALQFGFQRTGLSSVPTPIQFATPGRSRYAQRTASGLAALRGFPSELFLEERDRLTPKGIPSGGRTTSGRTR